MTENEFLLQDRIQKIQQIINKYGEENFYIAFSGGKDSTVLSDLVDWAIPNNSIPRVYADTGIELNMIRSFVYNRKEKDDRIVIIQPSKNIKETLNTFGYPFKSKVFSSYVDRYRRLGMTKSVKVFTGQGDKKWSPKFSCPPNLMYLFSQSYKPTFPISMQCCIKMKEEPMINWQKENKKNIAIIGIMPSEGGGRVKANCLNFDKKGLKSFQPLVPVTKEWEDWFIEEYDVEICDIYKDPYNFKRTGCKGCPFATNLKKELEILEKYFPEERKQCELIWGPVYDEYRRVKYRLK